MDELCLQFDDRRDGTEADGERLAIACVVIVLAALPVVVETGPADRGERIEYITEAVA